MKYNIGLFGQPGSSKTTCGLSAPGVEQHVWGSSEETTAQNFTGRTDILPHKTFDWYECLTDAERAKFTDEKVTEQEVALLTKTGRARAVSRYRRYIYSIKNDLRDGKRPELKTIFLDNGTPFSQDFQDYIEMTYAKEFETEKGNFNSIAFAVKFQSEFIDFMRVLTQLPINVIVSFHIAMAVDEETAARVNFMEDTKKGIRHAKEWQPFVMGKVKYALPGIFDWCFFLWAEENPGKQNEYFAKLEADASNVGIAKSRIQPFKEPGRIKLPKNNFYQFFTQAIEEHKTKGGTK